MKPTKSKSVTPKTQVHYLKSGTPLEELSMADLLVELVNLQAEAMDSRSQSRRDAVKTEVNNRFSQFMTRTDSSAKMPSVKELKTKTPETGTNG